MIPERFVHVETHGGTYDVVIGAGLLAEAGERIRAVSDASRAALISDACVADLYGLAIDSRLTAAGFRVCDVAFAPGEASKSWAVAGELLEALAQTGLGRRDLVVALGGGVVGDLAGFVAASYLRGVDVVQLPTTLLAQVDSSVGGKTGVDLSAGKNLAGAFKQPLLVLADVDTLASLPEPEWQSGLAEVAKSAVIDGEEFLGWLETNATALRTRTPEVVAEAVARCVGFKAGVVMADEREAGPRESLNYGHTLGHAIESVAGYGTVAHGIAVAEGIRFAARLAVECANASRDFVRRQDALLDALGVSALGDIVDTEAALAAMHSDKKARAGSVRFVLASSPGTWVCVPVSDATLREHLAAWASSKRRG